MTPACMSAEVVPLNDLQRQTASMRDDIDAAVAAVVASGWYVLGPTVSAFEAEFSAYTGVPHCVSVANGTEALELALRAVGCGPGRDVVTVANAGMYAGTAILAVGARPVFADIEPATMTMDPRSLEQVIGRETGAVVVTHLYGQLADTAGLLAVTRACGVPLIEDCAQAHGAERDGRKAAAAGTIGCFSFYPTKNLGALGDGGALVTHDGDLAERLRLLRQYGWRSRYVSEDHGRNSRLDEIQAAVLRAKLPRLDGWNARRREIVAAYRDAAHGSVVVPDPSGLDYVAHLCVVRTTRRDELRAHMEARGIRTDIHYPVPDHRQRAMQDHVAGQIALPQTEAASLEVLTLPCFPELTGGEIARVCDALAAFR
jgi:dTDP-4-amino-4,6-dideoxygalactose transaminase